MSNPSEKYVDAINRQYTALGKQIVDELQDSLSGASPDDVKNIVDRIWEKYDVQKQYQNMLISGIVGAVKISVDVPKVSLFKDRYLKNVKAIDGELLSRKIQNVTRTGEITDLIKQALTIDGKWQKAAFELVKRDITKADFPKYMSNLLDLARQGATISNDRSIFLEYRRAMARAQRNVDALINPNTSTLRRAYRDVIEATQGATEKQLSAAIDRAVLFKARNNAQRLATNEIRRAYGNARMLDISNDQDAVGVQVSLSGDHKDIGCVCEYIVDQDWGMGAGVYPIDKLPEYPFHPWCDCVLDPIYKGDAKQFDDTTDDDSEYDWEYNEIFIDEDTVEA